MKPKRKKVAQQKPLKPVSKRTLTRRKKARKEATRRKKIALALRRYHTGRKAAYLEGGSKKDRAWGKKLWEEAKKAKRAAKRKPPKIRKKDRPVVEVPEGYSNVGVERIGQIEHVLGRALETLGTEETRETLGLKRPLAADLRTHVNSDDSFDAELRVQELPRGLSVHDLSIYVENLIEPIPDTFNSIGFRTTHTEEFEGKKYDRVRGKVQVGTNFFRSRKKAIAFVTARMIEERFMDKRYHKPTEFYVRIHWSPYGIRPKSKKK